jgi:hypothetical protein
MKNTSIEKTIIDYLKSNFRFNFEINKKGILNREQELDIFIPKINIAFEINGLYWHSNRFKNKYYHLSKTKECEKNGIELFHFFEDDILTKKKIIQEKINIIVLNKKTKYKKRNLKIKYITNGKKNQFIKKHILTEKYFKNKTKAIGAFYNNNLIALMCFSKIKNTCSEWIVECFCFNENFKRNKIEQKLLQFFISNNSCSKINWYIERSFPIYKSFCHQLNFQLEEETSPEFIPIKKFNNKKNRYIRDFNQTNQKNKLGIWNCGCLKYILVT